MSISNNKKSLDKCILRESKLFSQVMVTTWTYLHGGYRVDIYVCSIYVVICLHSMHCVDSFAGSII